MGIKLDTARRDAVTVCVRDGYASDGEPNGRKVEHKAEQNTMKGCIKKRSESSWTIIIDAGKHPETGKRQQKWISVQGSKRDAEAELARLLNEVNTGAFVEPSKLTVGEFLDQWLTNYAENRVGAKTLDRY